MEQIIKEKEKETQILESCEHGYQWKFLDKEWLKTKHLKRN